ncbi:MAG: MBG domain-containing protein, partial [Paludibacter sp.]|nr:MBG domain-containing protein [Paludibacter sp.]
AILQVTKKEITVTANAISKMYGSEYIFTGNEFTTDNSQFVGNDSIFTVQLTSPGALKKSAVGDYNIVINKITGSGLGNYNIIQVSNILTVIPMPVTIIPNNINKPYSDLLSFSGKEFCTDKPLLNGDSISYVVFKSDGCAENAPVNDYDIFALQTYGVGNQNYDFTYKAGKLSVIQKSITAKIYPPEYLVYNAKNKEFIVTVSVPELIQNTDYYIHYTSNDGIYDSYLAPSRAGSYTATFELSSLSMLKYSMSTVPSENFIITKAPLIITANNATKTYGENLYLQTDAFKKDMNPLFGSDVIFGVYFECKGLADTASVKTYPIIPKKVTGSGIENYEIIFVDGLLTVNKKILTVKAIDGTKTYGDLYFPNSKSFYVDTHELIGNDMVTSVTLVSDGYSSTATIGYYSIKASDVKGIGMNNYLISYEEGKLQVLKKKISVLAKQIYKEYGSEYVFKGDEFEADINQFIGSDKVTGILLNSQGAQAIASVGEYSLSISNVSGNGIENYDITTQNAVLFVTPMPLVVMGNDIEKEYGDVLTFSGNEFTTDIPLYNNDTLSFTFLKSNGSTELAPIGVYDIIPTQATGVGSLNYSISYRFGKLKVVQKQLFVTAQNCVKEYGENDPSQTFNVTDKRGVEFQPSMFLGNTIREVGENVGVYKISKGTLSVSSSYKFTFNDAYLTIQKALPTIDPYFTNNGGQFIMADVLGSKNGDNPQGNLNIKIQEAKIDNIISVNKGTGQCNVSGLPNQMVEAELYYQGDENYLPATKTMKIYAVIYHSDGGKLISPITNFDGNESLKLETPTQDNNYVFEGWYEDEDFSSIAIRRIPVGTYHDVHLYAKWSVTYDDLSVVVLFNQILAVANPLNRDFLYNSTYKWYKDDVLLASTKQYCGFDNYVPTGNYRVEIYYLNNAPIILELSHSSVMQKSKMYPNPVLRNSELTLCSELAKQEGVSVEIYNLMGVRQTAIKIEHDTDKFMLSGFNDAGIYIIRLVQNGTIKETFKVMVED